MTETKDAHRTAENAMAAHGLTATAKFVPFSQTGKKATKLFDYSLNWMIAVHKDGREVLSSPYSAGVGHCPSYPENAPRGIRADAAEAVRRECETGRSKGKPIPCDTVSAFYCLLSDAEAIDCGSFEEWADNLGFDPDSRSAEKTYRICLETGLKLQNSLGDTVLSALREAFQDF